jgi:hypothetical protein
MNNKEIVNKNTKGCEIILENKRNCFFLLASNPVKVIVLIERVKNIRVVQIVALDFVTYLHRRKYIL